MDWYKDFLAGLPDPETVRAKSDSIYPASATVARLSHAAASFEVYYLQVRDALTALVGALEREDAARAATDELLLCGPDAGGPIPFTITGTVEPTDEEDEKDNEEFDTDDPGAEALEAAIAALEVEPLSVVDPERSAAERAV